MPRKEEGTLRRREHVAVSSCRAPDRQAAALSSGWAHRGQLQREWAGSAMSTRMVVLALTMMKERATVSSLFKTTTTTITYLIRPCPGNTLSFLIAPQLSDKPSSLLEHVIQLGE